MNDITARTCAGNDAGFQAVDSEEQEPNERVASTIAYHRELKRITGNQHLNLSH